MPKVRRAVILAICAVIVGGLAGLAVADPFHLLHARWFTAGLVLLSILLFTAAFAALTRRGLLRALVLVLGGIAALAWVTVVWLASQLVSDNREVSEVADGGRRLVVLESTGTIDPAYAVVVQSGSGPFEQQSLVYQGLEDVPAPVDARFVDADAVEVRGDGGCLYRSKVESVTLEIDPVHRPLRVGAC